MGLGRYSDRAVSNYAYNHFWREYRVSKMMQVERVPLCEYCNEPCCQRVDFGFKFYDTVKQISPDQKIVRIYCSMECAQEDEERSNLAALEDQREFEMWGDDLDSWYR